jgi:hypothetical protein
MDEELVIWGRTFRRTHGTGEIAATERASRSRYSDGLEEADWDEGEAEEAAA